MRYFYLIIRLCVLMCLSFFILSCNESSVDPKLYGSISGTVTTSEDGLPMEGVSITTNPGTGSVSTDADGNFLLDEVLVGDYSIGAKKEAYANLNTNISVGEGQEVIVQMVMNIAPDEAIEPAKAIYVKPLDLSKNLTTKMEFVWNSGAGENEESLFFDLILYEDGAFNGDTIAKGITDTVFVATNLKFETNYRWKVNVSNRERYETEGEEWKFRTEAFPENGYLFVKDTLGSKNIYSWDLTENHLVQLTKHGGSETNPMISHNEELIAYASNKDGAYHIYTMDTKGENVFKVTNSKPVASYHNNGSGFVWSPTGDKILYGHYGGLYRINSNGTGENKIASAPIDRHFKSCDWTEHFNNSSQEKIAVLTQGEKPYDNEIYLMDTDGSNLFLLVDNLEGTLSHPHFSPGGTKVIFSLDSLFQDDNGRQLNAKIYSIDIDGGNLTDLSANNKPEGTNDLQARYNETGSKIVFVNVANDGEGEKSIWTMDTDGSSREKVISKGEMPDVYNP